MVDEPPNVSGPTLDGVARQRLLAALQRELAGAGDEALARGVSREDLNAHLDERIALLRVHVDALLSDDGQRTDG